jgi:glucosamine--fructose-6-phosphate aminotransferase (isomerizing)
MVAKYWFEQFARVPVDIDFASEFRYREPVLSPGGLALFISRAARPPTRSPRCAIARRRADDCRRGQRPDKLDGARGRLAAADPRRARDRRCSTKAFTCQLAVLAAARGALRRPEGPIDRKQEADIVRHPARGTRLPQRRARSRRRDRRRWPTDRAGARRALPGPRTGLSSGPSKARSN